MLSDSFIPNPVAVIEELMEEIIIGAQIATIGEELDSDTTTSVTLTNIVDDLPTGIMAFKIEDELMLGKISGATLTFIGKARPTFGTVAITHVITTPIFLATFSDCVAKVYHMLAVDFKNDVPGVIYSLTPGDFNDDTGVQSTRVMMKIYGGEDLSQKYPKYYAQIVNGLWLERTRAFKQKRFNSGMVGSIRAEGGGQELLDIESGVPSWPFVLTFVTVEIL